MDVCQLCLCVVDNFESNRHGSRIRGVEKNGPVSSPREVTKIEKIKLKSLNSYQYSESDNRHCHDKYQYTVVTTHQYN